MTRASYEVMNFHFCFDVDAIHSVGKDDFEMEPVSD
jgi:hypothetical protein